MPIERAPAAGSRNQANRFRATHAMLGPRRVGGFTVMELILVLIIVAVLAAFAAPRLGVVDFSRRGFFDETLAATRFAHKLAIASGCTVQIDIDASNDRYALSFVDDPDAAPGCPDTPRAVPRPDGEGPFQASAPTGVDVSAGLSSSFDLLGSPEPPGSACIGQRRLVVERETGYARAEGSCP